MRERLLAVSAATLDRRLAPAGAVTTGQRRRRRSRPDSVRSTVPVRAFGDWQDPAPGFVEPDLVAHCGQTMPGSFVWTLVLTDIASGWTECVPLPVREAQLVVEARDRLRGAAPFPLDQRHKAASAGGSGISVRATSAAMGEQGDRPRALLAQRHHPSALSTEVLRPIVHEQPPALEQVRRA